MRVSKKLLTEQLQLVGNILCEDMPMFNKKQIKNLEGIENLLSELLFCSGSDWAKNTNARLIEFVE